MAIPDAPSPGGPSVRTLSAPLRALLLILGIAAFALGLYGRFKGLGTWPLGVDEFYISRSIDNIFRFGIPHFSCGGYYTRGVAYQYLVAGLRQLGGSAEFDGRVLPAVCSVAMLPAAFLLARRLAGDVVAWVCVILLAASTWEIEMARFARMYAPFQALFAWYLVVFLRYVVDRHERALAGLAALSVLGVLTWEGGVLLGAASLLAIILHRRNEQLTRGDWLRLAALAALLVLLYIASKDLRGFAPPPPDAGPDAAADVPSGAGARAMAWLLPGGLPAVRLLWLAVPALALAASAPWLRAMRARPLGLLAVLGASAAAALHLFSGAALLLVLAHLAGVLTREDYRLRDGLRFPAALVLLLAGWALVLLPLPKADLVNRLFGLPNLYQEMVRPWGRTLPLLSLELAAGAGWWLWRVLRAPRAEPVAGALLCVLVLMLVAVGAANTDRLETRYTFFLFPMLLILALGALQRLSAGRRFSAALLIVLPVACFAVTEDFSLRHVAAIDSAAVNFRVGMSPALAAHYYPRNNIRAAADWLRLNTAADAVRLSGVPNLAAYSDRVDYVFLRADDDRYDTYVCADGRTERWSERPVVYGDAALEPLVASGHPVYLVMYTDFARGFETPENRAKWSIKPVWTSPYGDTVILLLAKNRAPGES